MRFVNAAVSLMKGEEGNGTIPPIITESVAGIVMDIVVYLLPTVQEETILFFEIALFVVGFIAGIFGAVIGTKKA